MGETTLNEGEVGEAAGAAALPASGAADLPRSRQPHMLRRLLLRPEAGGAISAIVVFAFFAILAGDNGFLTPLGTADWLDTASELGIIAIPIGMLMIAGEFDLSVGSVVGASSMIVAIVSGYYELSPWLGVAIAFAAGGLVGLVNGVIVVWTRLPSFIVTLATMLMVVGGMLGISVALTGSTSISAVPTGAAAAVFALKWQEFHVSILYWIGLTILATYVMQRTPFGNWVYATGGNGLTARLAGVPIGRVKIVLFVCTSLGAVLAGTIETLTFQNGNITLGSQYVFTGIAACVIGGILLTGGYGSPIGTVFGALTYGIVSLGVFFLGWNADLTELFIGLLLLLAVLANHRLRLIAMGRE
jgi:simple sugar transport system permease protein